MHLVELERVKEVVELAVLGRLLEADKVLLQAVERELLLVVDIDLKRLWTRTLKSALATSGRRAGKGNARSA